MILNATQLMDGFAERTGLTLREAPTEPHRYLWTDAFAVCNFLGLASATREHRFADLALSLIDRVHQTLGRHRGDDPRSGWISGLSESEGNAHPTRGGLRIGKKLPERRAGEPFDDQLEWERDGQYFHYLTKWMHALDRASRMTGEPRFNLWARELAAAAYAAFSYAHAGGGRRLVWKMNIDLSHAVVPSMGAHDALDGFITYALLQSTAAALPKNAVDDGPDLNEEVSGLRQMIDRDGDWATVDPLGLGGLLCDIHRAEELEKQGRVAEELSDRLLAAALAGLGQYSRRADLKWPASARLGFRELGLSIGLHAVEIMGRSFAARVAPLRPYVPLASRIESFWLDSENRRASTWTSHRNISDVMLATSLVPEGFLSPDLLSQRHRVRSNATRVPRIR